MIDPSFPRLFSRLYLFGAFCRRLALSLVGIVPCQGPTRIRARAVLEAVGRLTTAGSSLKTMRSNHVVAGNRDWQRPGVKPPWSGNNGRVEPRNQDVDSAGLGGTELNAEHLNAAWLEAAGVVQSDQDADVRLEARGLMVAEMAEVEITERWLATRPGQLVRVLLRGGTWISGRIDIAAADHLVVANSSHLVLPRHAICAFSSLPRVLHHVPGVSPSWRSTLRDHLARSIVVTVESHTAQGRLTWVGRDHISIECEDGELTVPWWAIDSVAVTAASQLSSRTSEASAG